MATRPFTKPFARRMRFRSLPAALVERPLRGTELALLAATLLAGGTLYCFLYCLIAFPPMHGELMNVNYSAAWAAFTFLPWLLPLEICKRHFLRGAPPSRALVAALVATGAALALSVTAEQLANSWWDVHTRAFTFQAADRLAPLLMTAVLLRAAYLKMNTSASAEDGFQIGKERADLAGLPAPDKIDWIVAAGNYVEIQAGSRLLIRRLTMRQVEAMLDPTRFVRIPRSTIVNRDRIAAIGPGLRVRLGDGTSLRVGHLYRSNVERLRSDPSLGLVT